VEGAHRQLRAGLTDRLRGDDAHGLAGVHQAALNEHPSPDRSDNERLEFLGDAVLNLAIAQIIMDEYCAPRFPAGRRIRRRAPRAERVCQPLAASSVPHRR
jgi:dsRNA-specific ribonuclease